MLNLVTILVHTTEETVFDFLKVFLLTLASKSVETFLIIVTGEDIYSEELIDVDFNGEDREEFMLPSVHTCTRSLHLSRNIPAQIKFNALMVQV